MTRSTLRISAAAFVTVAWLCALLVCDARADALQVTAERATATLKWEPVAGAVYYNLYWSTQGPATLNDTKIVHVTAPYTHAHLTPGATYYYKLMAANAEGEKDPGLVASVTLVPAAPGSVDAAGGDRSVGVSWDTVLGAEGYTLYWNTSGNVTDKDTKIENVTSPYTHSGLSNGTRYFYRVVAHNRAGSSAMSAEASVVLATDTPKFSAVTAGRRQVTLAWDNIPSADTYHLYWSAGGGVTKQSRKIEYVTSAFIHTGLVPGDSYFYRLVAVNAAGESALSPEVSITLPPEAPNPAVIVDGAEPVTVIWSAMHGAKSYRLYWGTQRGVDAKDNKIDNVTSPYLPHELKEGVTYYYRVASVNDGGETLSAEVEVALRPAAPKFAKLTTASKQVELQWDSVVGAAAYDLYWNTTGNPGMHDTIVTNVSVPYMHRGLINGKTYYYRLVARNAGGNSPMSDVAAVTLPPDAPNVGKARGGNQRATVEWSAVSDADAYVVYWNTTGNVSTKDEAIKSPVANLQHENLRNGQTYYYRVAARNAGGESLLSPEVTVTLAPDVPTLAAAEAPGAHVVLNWTAIEGATSYHIYWSVAGAPRPHDQRIDNLSAPFEQRNLERGQTYSYRLAAVNAGGETLSAPVQVTLIPAVPAKSTARAAPHEINLTWGAIGGATSYDVYWNTQGNVTDKDAKLAAMVPQLVHPALQNGATYYYRISARNAGGASELSPEMSVTLAPDAPVVKEVHGGDKQTVLNWDALPGATEYRVYWNTTGNVTTKDAKIEHVTAPFTHKDITNGLTYHYLVTAVNAGGETLSAPARVTLIPDPPAAPQLRGGNRQAAITWGGVTGATSYNIYWKQGEGVDAHSEKIAVSVSPFTHPELANGLTYAYKITAVNEAGESPLSQERTVTLAPDAPVPARPANADRTITMTWDPVPGATSYRIYWNLTGGVSSKDQRIDAVTTPYVHSNLVRGSTYYYRVAALNAGGETLSSEVVGTVVPDATAISALKGADHEVTLGWKTVSGATEYHVYWNTSGDVGPKDKMLVATASTLAHTKIPNGAKYFYRIAAANAGGESGWSETVSVTLAPDHPVFSRMGGEDKKITLGWDPVPGALTYNIYWKLADARNTALTKIENVTSPYVFSGLKNGTKYLYSISAVNAGGEGFTSESITVTPHNAQLTGLFRDVNLQACVTTEASSNGWNYADEVAGILVCNDMGITNIAGVEWLENVTNLSLRNNKITDISKLSALPDVTYLALDGNNVSDVRALQNLTKLNYLSLSNNPISDLAPLSKLTALTSAYLNDTKVADLMPLSGLVGLQYLSLYNAQVTDVRPLANLKHLVRAFLAGNHIVDVSPLGGVASLVELDLADNEVGGKGVGKIDALGRLKNVRNLQLNGNGAISCAELAALLYQLGSPPVDVDGVGNNHDTAQDGETCVNP